MKYSRQRTAIMEYLSGVKCHPTADEVYASVRKVIPNISLGTVYRNLAQLADTGAIRKLRVGVMDHWDADLCPHAHFACKVCGRVYDLLATKMAIPVPDGFHVEREEAFLYGTCVHCNKMN